MYEQRVYRFPNSNEVELGWDGEYGAKGEKRAPRRKPTKEQIAKQNQWNRRKYMRRLIKGNFKPWDLWCTLKYPAGSRKTLPEVKKDLKNAFSNLRRWYKKQGFPLRFIYRIEAGKKGGIHIHMIINRLYGCGENTDMLLQKAWKNGYVYYANLYEEGGYDALAAYIVKVPETEEIQGQMSLFPQEEQKQLLAFSSSRNLKRPQPERKKYSHWTMRKILQDGPKPTPGYYIDQDSIIKGVNPFTGKSYLHYTEYKLGAGGGGSGPGTQFDNMPPEWQQPASG